MKGQEIREKFLKYFESRGHKQLPSSSLVPRDPTVLFTLAGMLQFKPIFLGEEKPKWKRVTTVQKCLRMVDIEKVGKTRRHHTFFEMLGNFSFGDYFKREAISWAWEFLTGELGLPEGRLSIAVYEKDDESYDIWKDEMKIPESRIFRLGEDNNFWSAGPTGPCGPCSEIYWDMGEEFGCGKPGCSPGCDCDRFLELWNLVFIEFDRDAKGRLKKLPAKNIDTGMGLERIASVLEGVHSNFETDLIKPLTDEIVQLAGAANVKDTYPVNVIADHARAVTHLIADDVSPGNEGRGYVLRRLIRRAVRLGRMLDISGPFLGGLAAGVIKINGSIYPELGQRSDYILKVIEAEENNFSATLEGGLKLLQEVIASLSSDKLIPGGEAFKLHDTFGFPLELLVEIAAESGYTVDEKGFGQEMEAQRGRARAAGLKKEGRPLDLAKFSKIGATKFSGYENLQADAKVIGLFPEDNVVVLNKTPFYPESGGQVGDEGSLQGKGADVKVVETFGGPGGVILHKVKDIDGLKPNMAVKATVDSGKRFSTSNHHTATHLLHKALRDVLGEHVRQTGSFVGPDHFRFDFTHTGALKKEEIDLIERTVNSKIKDDMKVEVFETSPEEARKLGAMALFGEKYGEKVRVIKIGDFSLELCGGTHVKNTGILELFKIRNEGALAAGVRRIEAVVGSKVIEYELSQLEEMRKSNFDLVCACKDLEFKKEKLGGTPLKDIDVFEITPEEMNTIKRALKDKDLAAVDRFHVHLNERNERLKDRIETIRKDIGKLSLRKIEDELPILISKASVIGGVKVVTSIFKDIEKGVLRQLCDKVLREIPSSVTLFGSVIDGIPVVVSSVSDDLIQRGLSAVDIVKAAAAVLGGGGGGKARIAEAGGGDAAKFDEAFRAAMDFVKRLMGG